MAYELDRRPGEWVLARSARRERRIVAGLVAFFLVDTLIAILVVGHRLTIGASAVFLAAVLIGRRPAERFVDRHVRMQGGALAEEAVGQTLNELHGKGWVVLHDIKPEGRANLDHIASGPTGVYVIETKVRRYDDAHLGRVMNQALWLHDRIDCFVTPVICLEKRSGRPFRHRGVWVVPHAQLLDWLRAQHNRRVEFERLARFADSL